MRRKKTLCFGEFSAGLFKAVEHSWQGKSPLVPHLSGQPADGDFPCTDCSLFLDLDFFLVWRNPVLSWEKKTRGSHSSLVRVKWKTTTRHEGFWGIASITDMLLLLKILGLELRQIGWFYSRSAFLGWHRDNSEKHKRKGQFSQSAPIILLGSLKSGLFSPLFVSMRASRLPL